MISQNGKKFRLSLSMLDKSCKFPWQSTKIKDF